MLQKIKDNLFTIHGAATSCIHLFIITGALACYFCFQVQVMGNDVTVGAQSRVIKNR